MEALIVAVAHHQYAKLGAAELRGLFNGDCPVLTDVKSIYDRQALADNGITVWRL